MCIFGTTSCNQFITRWFWIMEERNDIVIYQSEDGLVKMEAVVDPGGETIWATQKAIADLFGKDVSGISRHIRHVYETGELSVESTLQKMQIAISDKPVQYYNLDMIISLGRKRPLSQHRGKGRDAVVPCGQEPFVRRRQQANCSNSLPVVHAEQWNPVQARRHKTHFRCITRSTHSNDCREPHGRNGHDGKGRSQPY